MVAIDDEHRKAQHVQTICVRVVQAVTIPSCGKLLNISLCKRFNPIRRAATPSAMAVHGRRLSSAFLLEQRVHTGNLRGHFVLKLLGQIVTGCCPGSEGQPEGGGGDNAVGSRTSSRVARETGDDCSSVQRFHEPFLLQSTFDTQEKLLMRKGFHKTVVGSSLDALLCHTDLVNSSEQMHSVRGLKVLMR
jgi:hypothetical protein